MSDPLKLPPRLDLSAAMQLASDLRAVKGDIHVDLTGVSHLGALCLQTLIAASRHARAGGHAFHMTGTSDKVLEQMKLMGTSPETLMEGSL